MKLFFCLFIFINYTFLFGQTDSISKKTIEEIELRVVKEKNPMRAALYSAVIPGLGQIYNKKYWKIPLIYGLIGIGTSVMVFNNEKKNNFQEAFIAELNGKPHKFSGILNATSLARGIDLHKRQFDYAFVLTTLVYILNIFDANIDAHLSEFDKQFSLTPVFKQNGIESIGLNLKIKL